MRTMVEESWGWITIPWSVTFEITFEITAMMSSFWSYNVILLSLKVITLSQFQIIFYENNMNLVFLRCLSI